MSTKYQRPAGAYAGVAGANRSKYQTDSAAVPKVAMSSSKVDGDINYVIDALNELDNASGTRASIDERLSVSLNADGTLKGSVVANIDEWTNDTATGLARVSDSSFRIDGNQTGRYTAGKRVRLGVSGGYVYADVAESTFASSQTTVNCVNMVDAASATAVLTTNPTSLAYGPFTTGENGNSTRLANTLTLRGSLPALRLKKAGAEEFALRVNGSALEFVENTGSETSPTWSVRGVVNSTGLTPANGTVTLAKLATGIANTLVGFDGAGEATALSVGSIIPTGTVMPFAGSSTPVGWLKCDGSLVNRTTYAALFGVLGTTYGAGDGSTTFALPDLRGRSVFGVDGVSGRLASASSVGAAGGSATKNATTDGHALTVAEMPAHTHGYNTHLGSGGGLNGSGTYTNGGSTTVMTTNSAGSGTAHSHSITALDVVPPFMAMNFMVRT
ncbi:MAG: tail fiber protein [Alphaproteobacteria bacterium]